MQNRDLFLAPLLGILTTLGFPPFDLKPLSLLALAALIALAARVNWKRAALLGWLFGLAHFASGIYWIYISTHIYGGAPAWLSLMLCAALFAYMALYPALVLSLLARRCLFDARLGYLAFPALWLLSELLRGWVYSGFPWLALGYVALDTPLQKLAPLLGVHGLSALLALMAYALYRAVTQTRRARGLAAAVLAAPPLLAVILPAPASWTRDEGAPLKTAIIQANIPQDQKWLPQMQLPTLLRYRDMTLAALDADLIIWPEVALTQPYHVVKDNYLGDLAGQVQRHDAALLFGVLVREDGGYYNSLLALGAAQGRYDKRHLVPFGEYFPIPGWLRPVMDVLGTPYSDFLFGADHQPPITVKGQRLGAYICFEDVFAAEFRRSAQGTTLLVNVTNDAWFGHSGAAAQHLQMARMRSLETGRVTLRASNTGVSAVIGADGAVQARAGFFTTETLRATAQPRTGMTPYMRWGDTPLWLLSGVAAVLLFWRRRSHA